MKKTVQERLHDRINEMADATSAAMVIAYNRDLPGVAIDEELAELEIAQRFGVPLKAVHKAVERFREPRSVGCAGIIQAINDASNMLGEDIEL